MLLPSHSTVVEVLEQVRPDPDVMAACQRLKEAGYLIALDDYVEKDMGSAELLAAGHDPALVERVIRLIDTAEYKRRQYPPGPKISPKNFGRDRRLPITNRWRESL